jgi:hypothetical protein
VPVAVRPGLAVRSPAGVLVAGAAPVVVSPFVASPVAGAAVPGTFCGALVVLPPLPQAVSRPSTASALASTAVR